MATIGTIQFNKNPTGDTKAEVNSPRIKALILTREGTVPGSRSFGLGFEFFDKPAPDAINLLELELAEKMPIYTPEVEASGVEGDVNIDGTLNIKIHLTEGSEESDD